MATHARDDTWEPGAIGEQRVGPLLERLRPFGAVPLHDRRIPGSQANIDHVVIAPSGVWIVDSKNYRGRIERRGRRSDARLFVDRRDRTSLVTGTTKQYDAVRYAITNGNVPIHRVLCFTGSEWPFFAKPFELDGVWVTWPKALIATITHAGGDGVSVSEISAELAERLPAAS
jgi:hypothetical protein